MTTGEAVPPPNISVIAITTTKMGHVRVKVDVSGITYTVTVPRRLASVDTISWTTHALVALQAAQRLKR